MAVASILGACGDDGSSGDRDAAAPDGGGRDAAAVVPCGSDGECDDGLFCTGSESCAPGAPGADARGCVRGAPIDCDDSDACTADLCSEDMRSCEHVPADEDGDGHAPVTCRGDDCDDADPNRFAGNLEVCDVEDHDEDCDPETYGFRDLDADGWPDDSCCNGADGDRVCGDDCDDMRPGVHPALAESCDTLDNDCDGRVDEGVLTTFWPDADGDDFGSAAGEAVMSCLRPSGFAETSSDCDDARAEVNPGAAETCFDSTDHDCDGAIDESGSATFYPDSDRDGHGDSTRPAPATSCETPPGYLPVAGDCNDSDAAVHPGARETCNGVDDDCSSGGGIERAEDADGDLHAASGDRGRPAALQSSGPGGSGRARPPSRWPKLGTSQDPPDSPLHLDIVVAAKPAALAEALALRMRNHDLFAVRFRGHAFTIERAPGFWGNSFDYVVEGELIEEDANARVGAEGPYREADAGSTRPRAGARVRARARMSLWHRTIEIGFLVMLAGIFVFALASVALGRLPASELLDAAVPIVFMAGVGTLVGIGGRAFGRDFARSALVLIRTTASTTPAT